jgi:hypothetical protein
VNVVSFGKYLYNYSLERSLPTDKAALQDLGNSFIQGDAGKFLTNVLRNGLNGQRIVLIEGIRHVKIFTSLKAMSKHSYFMYIDAASQLRYTRYCQRHNYTSDIFPFDEFQSLEDHVVESEIKMLKDKCDTIIYNESINVETLNSLIYTILLEKVEFLK